MLAAQFHDLQSQQGGLSLPALLFVFVNREVGFLAIDEIEVFDGIGILRVKLQSRLELLDSFVSMLLCLGDFILAEVFNVDAVRTR